MSESFVGEDRRERYLVWKASIDNTPDPKQPHLVRRVVIEDYFDIMNTILIGYHIESIEKT